MQDSAVHQVSEHMTLRLWQYRKSEVRGCTRSLSERFVAMNLAVVLAPTQADEGCSQRAHCHSVNIMFVGTATSGNNNKQWIWSRVGRDWLSTSRKGSRQTLGHSDRIYGWKHVDFSAKHVRHRDKLCDFARVWQVRMISLLAQFVSEILQNKMVPWERLRTRSSVEHLDMSLYACVFMSWKHELGAPPPSPHTTTTATTNPHLLPGYCLCK